MKLFSFLVLIFFNFLYAKDYRTLYPKAWSSSNLNKSAISLYGKEKFSTIKKSIKVELIAPKITIANPTNIPIKIKSSLKAKTVALFQDKEERSLIIVFDIPKDAIIDYEFNIQKEIKGTLFAVIEGLDNKLYYTRAFIDVFCMSCMRKRD